MEIGKIRRAVMGEIPQFYAMENIYANQGLVAMHTNAIADNAARNIMPLYMAVVESMEILPSEIERRRVMVESFKTFRANGHNRETYGSRFWRGVRKAFLWAVFFGFIFCVAYTLAGLATNGFDTSLLHI